MSSAPTTITPAVDVTAQSGKPAIVTSDSARPNPSAVQSTAKITPAAAVRLASRAMASAAFFSSCMMKPPMKFLLSEAHGGSTDKYSDSLALRST